MTVRKKNTMRPTIPGDPGRIPFAAPDLPGGHVPDKHRGWDELHHLPLREWTDPEVLLYLGHVMAGLAHLAGGLGALKPRHCLAFSERLTKIAKEVS